MREIILTPDRSNSGKFEQLWFLWQKSPPPPLPGWGKFFDIRSIHFRQFWATLVFVAEKPSPPRMREKILTPDLSISGNFKQLWFLWQKSLPSTPPRMREKFLTPDISNSGNFEQIWFLWQKSPPPCQDEGKIFDTRSIQFRQFRATLVFVAEKCPPRMREQYLTPDLSTSGNFEQLWFLWQNSPPPGKNFWHQIYPIQAILRNLVLWQKSPPPQDEGNFFDTRSIHFSNFKQIFPQLGRMLFCHKNQSCLKLPEVIHFRKFWATLVFVAKKPPPLQHEGKFFDIRSIHFRQFWATFGFCGRKAPPPQDEGIFFDTRSIHFRQFWATLVFVAEKLPLQDKRKFFDIRSIHFRQFQATLVFEAEKPPPPKDEGKIFDTRSTHFRQFWPTLDFCGRKAPLPPRMRENVLTSDLSISGNFKQIFPHLGGGGCFCGRKIKVARNCLKLFISRIFEQLWFLWQKSPPPSAWGKIFWHQIYPIQAILSNFGFCGRKAPPPQDEEKNFDTRSIHFRQFRATLVLWKKSPAPPTHPRMSEIFLTPDLSNSGNFEQLWFLWQKSPPPHSQDEGKIFDIRSIHFR